MTNETKKFGDLSGKFISLFLIPIGVLLFLANDIIILLSHENYQLRGGHTIGSMMILLGISSIIFIPKNIRLDFFKNRNAPIELMRNKDINIFGKIIWILIIVGCLIYGVF